MMRGEIYKQSGEKPYQFGQIMVPNYTWRNMSPDSLVANFNDMLRALQFYRRFDATIRALGEGHGNPDYRDPNILNGLDWADRVWRNARGED